jgi:hypothetical protein
MGGRLVAVAVLILAAAVTFLTPWGAGAAKTPRGADPSTPDPGRWEEHVAFLASDALAGRAAGTPGYHRAARYVAEPGSAEEALMTTWLRERYHSPADGPDQPIDRSCVQSFSRILFEVTKEVADRSQAPRWNRQSVFGFLAAQGERATTPSAGAVPQPAPPPREP